jgi:bacterioferritin
MVTTSTDSTDRPCGHQASPLGGSPAAVPEPVRVSSKAREILRFDLNNENDTIRTYRVSAQQCEAFGEYAVTEEIREILRTEQEHRIDPATALGEEVPDIGSER